MRTLAPEDLKRGTATDPALRRYADGIVGYSPIVLYVAIRDEEGVAFFHSDPNQEGRRLEAAETLSAFSRRSVLSQLLALSGGNRVLVADIPFGLGGVKSFDRWWSGSRPSCSVASFSRLSRPARSSRGRSCSWRPSPRSSSRTGCWLLSIGSDWS